MKKEYYFTIVLTLFICALFVFGSGIGSFLQAALRGQVSDNSETANISDSFRGIITSGGNTTGLKVSVYSQYPLNLKNQLSIAAGSAEGIQAGDIAISNGHLVGIVEKTFAHSALVQTLFDKRFQIPVRVGVSKADALLRGGNDPELSLISIDAPVAEGDMVMAASDGMPYGALIGSVRGLHDSNDKVFKEGQLFVPYSVGSLQEIDIIPSPKR